MARRSVVCDYAGEEIYPGDLVCYAARQGNRVRMTDAIVLRTYVKRINGRLVPWMDVQPTGDESGFIKRRSMRAEDVAVEHVRLIQPGTREGEVA